MIPATNKQDDARPITAAHSPRAHATLHRLVIFGEDESEVVCAAGGLIYDWSSGGWDIVVHLAATSDGRPLQILGARTRPLTSPDSLRSGSLWPDAIIASPLVYRQEISVRDYFTRALLRNHAATAMLGDNWPAGLGQDIGQVKHRLSPGARAFKLQAMLAAELAPASLDSVEILRGCPQQFTSHRSITSQGRLT